VAHSPAGTWVKSTPAPTGQTISGVVNVLDAVVTIKVELPGVLGMIASGLKRRLEKAGQLLLTKK